MKPHMRRGLPGLTRWLPLNAAASGLVRPGMVAAFLLCAGLGLMVACSDNGPTTPEPPDPELVTQGKEIFRFDTFGDETFWTDTLQWMG